MQEEVTQRTVALCAEATKLSAGMLQQAMKKVLDEMQKEVTGHKTRLHHGKQTLRQLMNCLLEDLGPGHFLHVVLQRHGMCHHLEAVIQGTVMLAVQILQAVSVGDLHDSTCAGVIRASPVDFQLYAEILRAIATKQRFRLVIIVFDCFISPCMGVTVIAERIIFIVILVIGIIQMDNTSAAFTAGIVPVIAGRAEGRVFIPGIVIPVDTLSAVGANHGLLICTAFAKCIVTHHDAILQWVLLSTVTADKSLSHHRHSL